MNVDIQYIHSMVNILLKTIILEKELGTKTFPYFWHILDKLWVSYIALREANSTKFHRPKGSVY